MTVSHDDAGYHRARVSEIARQAGVAQGTVHLYFESKEQLYLAILDRFAEALRRTSEGLSWTDIRTAVDLRSRFSDLYTEIFELCARNRGVAGLLLGGPPVGDRSIQIRSRLIDEAEAISVAFLEAGAAAGLLRPVPTKPVARTPPSGPHETGRPGDRRPPAPDRDQHHRR